MSFLKIQTPSNNFFSIDLGTSETDFIKLLSCLSEIDEAKIKGLRDIYGNYYTISSAINNPQGNFNYSYVYFLVFDEQNNFFSNQVENVENFSNFPSNHIPNSFSHDAKNYYKRKNISNTNFNEDCDNPPGYFNIAQIHNSKSVLNNNDSKFFNPREELYQNPSGRKLNNLNFINYKNDVPITKDFDHEKHFYNNPNRIQSNKKRFDDSFEKNSLAHRQKLNNFSQTSNKMYSMQDDFVNHSHRNVKNSYRIEDEHKFRQDQIRTNYNQNNLNMMNNFGNNINRFDLPYENHNLNNRNVQKNNLFENKNILMNKIKNTNMNKLAKFVSNQKFGDQTPYNQNINYPMDPLINNNSLNIPANPSVNYSEYTNFSNSVRFPETEFFKRNFINQNGKSLSNNYFHNVDNKQTQIEYYLKIANDLVDLNLIEDRFLPKLKQMILNENEDISTMFKFFCQDIIEIETLISGINKILSWTLSKLTRPDSPELLNKNQLVKLIESLDDSIFDDPADHILLRNLANYNNEFILAAYELYLSDYDIENFIDSIKRFIKKYNRPLNNNFQEMQNFNSNYNLKGEMGLFNFNNQVSKNNNQSLNILNLNRLKNLNNLGVENVANLDNQILLQNRNNYLPFKNNNENSIRLNSNINKPLTLNRDDSNKNNIEIENELATKDENNKNFKDFNDGFKNPHVIKNDLNDNNIGYNNINNIAINRNETNINKFHNSLESNQSKPVGSINLNVNNSSDVKNNQFNSFQSNNEIPVSVFNTDLHNQKQSVFSNNGFLENNIPQNLNSDNNENINRAEKSALTNNSENKNIQNANAINPINTQSFENILKFLHTEQRIIFKYALKNKLPEVNVFAQLHSTIESEDILLRTIKIFCKQFIVEKITKNYDENTNNILKSLMQKRDIHFLGLFKELNRHNSIEKLKNDVFNFIRDSCPDYNKNKSNQIIDSSNASNGNQREKDRERYEREKQKEKIGKENWQKKKSEKQKQKNPKEKDKEKYEKENQSFSSSDSDANFGKCEDSAYMRKESENKMNMRNSGNIDSENENDRNNNQNNYINENSSAELNKNYKFSEFLKLLNNFNFFTISEKEIIENLISEKSAEALEIYDQYLKSKNILAIKSSLKDLIKKNINKRNQYNQKIENTKGKNEYKPTTRTNSYNRKGGEILSKLEKNKKKNISENNKTGRGNQQEYNRGTTTNNMENDSDNNNSPSKKTRVNNKREIKSQNYVKNESLQKNTRENVHHVIQNENSDESENSSNVSKQNIQMNENKIYYSLDELLQDLENSQKISSHQHKYIIHRFKNKDDILMSAWEVYTYNKHLPDLIESLKIFSTNVRRQSNVITMGKTPVALAKSKNDIIDFLKSKDNNREKEEIKKKQLNIIEILVKENMLDKKTAPIINQMIFEENHFLISAFEIFSVSKDHWEFCETLGMITDIYCNDGKKMTKSSSSLEKVIPTENKDSRLAIIFENFIKINNIFKEKEIEIFKKKLFTKDEFFMSALEFYENNLDKDEFIENLQQVLK